MSVISDPEFGDITVRRQAKSRSVRIRVGTNRQLIASAPSYTPIFIIKRIINTSRPELRKLLDQVTGSTVYSDGDQVGKSHTIAVVSTGMVDKPTVSIARQKIVVKLPHDITADSPAAQTVIRQGVTKALRKEAKAYLDKRLRYLADTHGFHYKRVRFSHAGGRWGSCSSSGTISLNIALMKLPHELIDYVLIHELSHTVEMNHSSRFWDLVETYDPHAQLHRKQIKLHTPSV